MTSGLLFHPLWISWEIRLGKEENRNINIINFVAILPFAFRSSIYQKKSIPKIYSKNKTPKTNLRNWSWRDRQVDEHSQKSKKFIKNLTSSDLSEAEKKNI